MSAVLNNMVQVLPDNPSVRLLKHVIRCYLRLSDNARAREALRQCLPPLLMDLNFTACLKDDMQTRGWVSSQCSNGFLATAPGVMCVVLLKVKKVACCHSTGRSLMPGSQGKRLHRFLHVS